MAENEKMPKRVEGDTYELEGFWIKLTKLSRGTAFMASAKKTGADGRPITLTTNSCPTEYAALEEIARWIRGALHGEQVEKSSLDEAI